MYRVLHIMAGADAGGISSVVLNYYRFLDREKIHFDIALTTDQDGQNGQALRQLGAEVYRLPLKSQGVSAFETALRALLDRQKYDAIHVHENETSYVALRVAQKAGIRQRIAHSHTTSPYVSLKGEIRRLSGCVLNDFYATHLIGCGELAGNRVFGRQNMKKKKAMILPNGVDIRRFAYEEQLRQQVREELGVRNALVLGMVGRLSPEKNHSYALKLMETLHRVRPEAVLLLVGNGAQEDALRRETAARGLEACVRFLGRRQDVERLYQAFDVLLMPSLYEGFPVAAVEAMAAGLPVLLSDTITEELAFGEAVQHISLADEKAWLDRVCGADLTRDRTRGAEEACAHGLDIRENAKLLERLYLTEEK